MITIRCSPYCVYSHSDGKGEVFYVGSGPMYRAFYPNTRGKAWKKIADRLPFFDVEIIAFCATEQEARKRERLEIIALRPKANKVRFCRTIHQSQPSDTGRGRPRKYSRCPRYANKSHRLRLDRSSHRLRCPCGFSTKTRQSE